MLIVISYQMLIIVHVFKVLIAKVSTPSIGVAHVAPHQPISFCVPAREFGCQTAA